jgi:hypothetical protein
LVAAIGAYSDFKPIRNGKPAKTGSKGSHRIRGRLPELGHDPLGEALGCVRIEPYYPVSELVEHMGT